ncbi:MAG: S8 family serine peptidase [Kiloniellales bacterium]|jgi:subtilisin family serine protease|nr:S8 family serine peptidase [Kiloniellales bacterium]
MSCSVVGFSRPVFLAAVTLSLTLLVASQARDQVPISAPTSGPEAALAGSATGGQVPGDVPAEVLVVGPAPGLAAEAARLGLQVAERLALGGLETELVRLAVPRGGDAGAALEALRARFPEAGIDLDTAVAPAAATVGAGLMAESWVRAAIGWAPADGECGRGIRIGMIDASVDVGHPALAGQRLEYRSFHNPERRPSEAEHGTAVAAMLIGKPSPEGWGGILPGAELKAANVFEYNEEGRLIGNAVALLQAFDWMVEEGVRVVNLSMAGQDNEALRYVIEHARQRGLVSVAAAGNWGRLEPAYPAGYEDVIAVTAFDLDGRLYDKANRGAFIDFAAPGVEVWTAVPHGGRVQSGTSFAVPYVTAQVAVEVAHGAAAEPDALRRLLQSRVTDMGAPGRDDDYGWGFVAGAPSCG